MSSKSEVQRLGRLVRRFVLPGHPPFPGQKVTRFHLRHFLGLLWQGANEVLPAEHPLLEEILVGRLDNLDPIQVWSDVAAMPWDEVEAIIWEVHKDYVFWKFEFGQFQ